MKSVTICRYQAPQFVEQPKQQYKQQQQQQPRQSRPYYNAVNEGDPFFWKIKYTVTAWRCRECDIFDPIL